MNGDLPEVLALLHLNERRWRTLRAEGEEWQDNERAREVFTRLRNPGGFFTMRGTPGPASRSSRWKVWVRKPDKARVEHTVAEQRRVTQITNGRRRWMSFPDGRASIDEGPGPRLALGPPGVLIETKGLPASLDLEVVGRGRVLERETYSLRGRSRVDDPRSRRGLSHPLLQAADQVLLEVDAERGVILRLDAVLDGLPVFRVAMTDIAFDEELPDDLFFDPPAAPVQRARPLRPGPPEDVLGADAGVSTVLARTSSVVVAVERIVAYPTGFELSLTVRTRDEQLSGTVESSHPRAWGGTAAFPGESLRVGVAFSDGRAAWTANFREAPPPQGVSLVPISGSGTSGRFDQRFWVHPLPPPGPLRLMVHWPIRGIAETGVEVPAEPILGAAAQATPLWPEAP